MIKGDCVVCVGVVLEMSGAVTGIIRPPWEPVSPPEKGRVGRGRSQWEGNAVLLRAFANMFVSSLLPETMASPGKDNYRMKSYKNNALNPEEMRRRREEEGIQLRKQKREQQVG